jgi:superoxide reductase
MNERRDFLKATLALGAAVAVGSASRSIASTGTFPAGVVYTAENPGQWAAKVGSHAPIVSHTLVAEDGTLIGAITFAPDDKEAVSTYELPAKAGSTIYATSFCNQHDFWLTEFTL